MQRVSANWKSLTTRVAWVLLGLLALCLWTPVARAVVIPPKTNQPPVIIRHPVSRSLFNGATVFFTVEATGTGPLHYQWYFEDAPIPGATSTLLTILNAQQPDIGQYHVVVTNLAGSAVSHPAYLNLNALLVDLPHPGTVVNFTGALLPAQLTNMVALAAGTHHALAVREDGTVAAWGSAIAGTLGVTNVPAGLSNVIAVSAGDDFSLALRLDGLVTGWGSGASATVQAGLFGVVALATAPHRAVALNFDGTLTEWGAPATLPPGLSDVAAVAATATHTLVAHRDGTVELFGTPAITLLASPTNAVAVAAADSFFALCADGAVLDLAGLGTPMPSPLNETAAVSTRNGRSLALGVAGTITAWGDVVVPAVTNTFSAVAAGGLYCLALSSDPPKPRLAMGHAAEGCKLFSPVAVSGYLVEAEEELGQPFAIVNFAAEGAVPPEAADPSVTLPAKVARRFFRLRHE